MDLEQVEELCLNYLRQSENPLVSVSKLLAHCRRDAKCAGIDTPKLLEFLRAHGQIHVMEGPADAETVNTGLFSEVGLDMGPRAILDTRTPSKKEIAAMMAQQLEAMTASLSKALDETRKKQDAERQKQLTEALERAEDLRDQMKNLFG